MVNVMQIRIDSGYRGIESYRYDLLRSIGREQAFFTFIGYRDRSAYERKLEHFELAAIELLDSSLSLPKRWSKTSLLMEGGCRW